MYFLYSFVIDVCIFNIILLFLTLYKDCHVECHHLALLLFAECYIIKINSFLYSHVAETNTILPLCNESIV